MAVSRSAVIWAAGSLWRCSHGHRNSIRASSSAIQTFRSYFAKLKSDTRCRQLRWWLVDVLSFIPRNDIGDPNLVETGEEGEGGKQEGSDDPLPLFEGLEDGGL